MRFQITTKCVRPVGNWTMAIAGAFCLGYENVIDRNGDLLGLETHLIGDESPSCRSRSHRGRFDRSRGAGRS